MDALQGYAWLPAFWSRFSACAEHPGLGLAGKFVRDPDDALSSCAGRAVRNRAQGENAGGDRQNFYTELACIAHKSLEICDRCRLWQRNSPATPETTFALRATACPRTAKGRAIAKRRRNSAAFWREEFENSLFRFIYFKTGPAPYPFAAWQCTRLESARIWCWAFQPARRLLRASLKTIWRWSSRPSI